MKQSNSKLGTESQGEAISTTHSDNTLQYSPEKINALSDLKEETRELLKTAGRTIKLYTHYLDPRILNARDIESAITAFIKKSRNSKVEILIYDEQSMQGFDHRLVKVAQRYTSYVSIKVVPKDYHENIFNFYLVDDRRMIYRPLEDRFEAENHQQPTSRTKEMSKYFKTVWDQAAPASHLRALHI